MRVLSVKNDFQTCHREFRALKMIFKATDASSGRKK